MSLSLNEERKLIEEAKSDWQAFEKLYNLYLSEIYYYVLARTKEKELAQDICSETFIKAMENIKKFKWQGYRFSSWLYRIASNRISEHYRKNSRLSNIDEEILVRIEDKDSLTIEEKISREQEKENLMRAIKQLKPLEQSIVILKYFQDKSYEEIAEITGFKANNIGVKLHRILKKLEKHL